MNWPCVWDCFGGDGWWWGIVVAVLAGGIAAFAIGAWAILVGLVVLLGWYLVKFLNCLIKCGRTTG